MQKKRQRDKKKNALYFKKWWKKNKHLHRQRVSNNRKQRRAYLRQCRDNYLQHHPCVDCGNSDIRVLEFDHVRRTKKENIANMLQREVAWNTILKEISKCDVRCANCHRIKHHEERKNKKT